MLELISERLPNSAQQAVTSADGFPNRDMKATRSGFGESSARGRGYKEDGGRRCKCTGQKCLARDYFVCPEDD